MSLDKLLSSASDIQTVIPLTDALVAKSADRIDPYIREAQVIEIRNFLGDELYNNLLKNLDVNALNGYYDFLTSDKGWFNAFSFEYVPGQGWKFPSGENFARLRFEGSTFTFADLQGEPLRFQFDVVSSNTVSIPIDLDGLFITATPTWLPGTLTGTNTYETKLSHYLRHYFP